MGKIETDLVRVGTPERADLLVRHDGRRTGTPVVLVHGNISSSVFWEETLLALPEGLRGLAPDLRGFGGSQALPVDATRGLRDFSDDLGCALDELGLDRVHLVGWSMGGGVIMQHLIDHPERVLSLTLVNPVSPYGFGGTVGVEGTLMSPDGAGSGGGTVNPEFVARLAAGDADGGGPASPREVLRGLYVAEGPPAGREDDLVASMLSTRVGDDNYPGDHVPSEAWPHVAPGRRGVLNTMAPTYCDLTGIVTAAAHPPVLWIRGSVDQIVSDTSALDLAVLGRAGAVPGWPGEGVAPPQPMVAQTRAVLERYAAAGGRYQEVVVEGAGHSPHVERPAEFRAALFPFLEGASREGTSSGSAGG